MTIWYDYTTTLRNTGRSGIANVEWSVGQALASGREDVAAFALRGRRLVAIDPVRDLSSAVYASAGPTPPSILIGSPSRRTLVRHTVISELQANAPWAVAPSVRALGALRRLRTRVGSHRPARLSPDRPLAAEFGPDDVLVSMGADWGGGLAGEIGRIREAIGCRVVTMVYDLIPLTHPHLAFHNDPALFTAYYRRLIRVSDLITCISERSRQDLIEFATAQGLTPPPTVVLRLGEQIPDDRVGPSSRGDFFLWVGTVERRKNLELLYDALRILDSQGRELPRILVVGGVGWGVEDLLAELDLKATAASRAIVRLGSVDEVTLDGLYRRARALLFPSQYEGWGLPVREASIRGCPVAAGDSPAVREAAAGIGGVTLLPVDDPWPWADYLAAPVVACDPAKPYPWSATAAALASLADQLANSGRS